MTPDPAAVVGSGGTAVGRGVALATRVGVDVDELGFPEGVLVGGRKVGVLEGDASVAVAEGVGVGSVLDWAQAEASNRATRQGTSRRIRNGVIKIRRTGNRVSSCVTFTVLD